MKLRVIFSDVGETVPDLKARKWLKDLIFELNNYVGDTTTIYVGTNAMINEIRCAVLPPHKHLDYENVVFVFNGEEINIDKNGRLNNWPKGFCDTMDEQLDRLLDWNKSLDYPLNT